MDPVLPVVTRKEAAGAPPGGPRLATTRRNDSSNPLSQPVLSGPRSIHREAAHDGGTSYRLVLTHSTRCGIFRESFSLKSLFPIVGVPFAVEK